MSLNTVDSVEGFCADITGGQWDAVLKAVAPLKLPDHKLLQLYEQVLLELAELRELGAARAVLRGAPACQLMARQAPERFARLEALLSRTYFDSREAYGAAGRDRRRAALAAELAGELAVAPPSRLLALLGQALRWQQRQGLLPAAGLDLFRGKAAVRELPEDESVSQPAATVRFGRKSHVEAARFSPDGQYLVTGSVDGLVEVWNYSTGKIRKDLRYQAQEQFMSMDSAALCLAFSRDSDLLAAGDNDGKIKVWRITTGQVVRRLERAHSRGVTCLQFSRDSTQLLSSSFDGTVRIHGLKSGKMLKEFRGHSSFVNAVMWSADGHTVYSAGSDGTVRAWAARGAGAATGCWRVGGGAALQGLLAAGEWLLVLPRGPAALLLTTAGQLVRELGPGRRGAELAAVALSARGRLAYVAGDDKVVYSVCVATGKPERSVAAHDQPIIGLAHHPHQNLLATYGEDGLLKLWKP